MELSAQDLFRIPTTPITLHLKLDSIHKEIKNQTRTFASSRYFVVVIFVNYFLQVFSPNSNVQKFKAKFSVFNTRNEEVPATVYTGTQQLNGYFEYIRRDLLISHIQPHDEIQLFLNLTILSDTITKNSQNNPNISFPEPRPAEVYVALKSNNLSIILLYLYRWKFIVTKILS